MAKVRLDQLVLQRGLADSRTQAQSMIMAGEVRSNDMVLLKPGQSFDEDIPLEVTQKSRYVSRAGEKLASVAQSLNLDFKNKVVLDAGSSTGGFTDFALQNGARKVYAVDVGNAQLAYKLRQDNRVVSMERTDIRDVMPYHLNPLPDMAVADVSFISLSKILPSVAALVKPNGLIVAMMKPQFETDKETADRFRGIIDDENERQEILAAFEKALTGSFNIIASADSGVAGAKGNRERFYAMTATSL
ncbi:TlyA family RNA methyltransferase [Patescibacteria group bacterium]|nr:MAG: TlyA family RNA methyltransferase [Patescibacteria group bacterium]